MTPEGQLKQINTIINRENNINRNLVKKGIEIKLSEEARNNILKSKNAEELKAASTKAIEELSEQVPATLGNSLRSWRYLSMLGNVKTHIRNVVSNVAMKSIAKVKKYTSSNFRKYNRSKR